MNYFNDILETIGGTPLVKINKIFADTDALILAKIESFNPGHSIKDRIGLRMIEDAEKQGLLKQGSTIVEATSGNTGMGIALACKVKGYRCIFTVPSKVAIEKIDILRAVGAEVIVCPYEVAPEDPSSYYSMALRLSQEIPNAIWINQYDNLSNRMAHYWGTGKEIWEQTKGKVTHLICTAGTCGTISGTAQYLKEKNEAIQVWAIDPYGSVLKTYFETGVVDPNENYSYISEGFGKDTVPKNLNIDVIDHFEKISDLDGALMARRMAREEGLFMGYSAGSTAQGLYQLRHQLKPTDVAVCIFHDHGSRYVSKIYNDKWMIEKFGENALDSEVESNQLKVSI